MNYDLTSGVSLMSEIIDYLSVKEVAQCRYVSRSMKVASEQQRGNWRQRVKREYHGIKDCGVCTAMVKTLGPLDTLHKSVEWCGLCNNIVCVDHLRICDECSVIHCCVCVCCSF